MKEETVYECVYMYMCVCMYMYVCTYACVYIYAYIFTIKWMGHVTRMGRRKVHTEFWWGNLRERDQLEDPGVGGRVILSWTFVRAWTGLI
jgi:hypothetical protein